jgi:FkbM family methyltransferase
MVRGTIRQKVDYDDAWLLALAQDAHIVFDVGSNIGQSAVLLLHSGHVSQIVLIEPNPAALSQAAENLILNGWSDKARFVCAFAADRANQVQEFFTVGAGAAGSMYPSHARTASTLGASCTVTTVTVDQLVEQYQLVPNLVKIDVEGAEILVLRGAKSLAQKQVTRFFVEMHSGASMTMFDNARQVLDWCDQYNYRSWYLKEKIPLSEPSQIASRGRCHLLLLPHSLSLPASLARLEQGDALDKVSNPRR